MDDDRTSAGPILADRYALGAVLGRGGMGTVHDATDLRLGRVVAVKILRPELAEQPRARRRFESEARAAARLAHPNVVTVFDSGEDGAVPFLVMERLPGGTLADEIAAGPMPVTRAFDGAREVLAALDAAHRAGIIHRDIKPGNVLLDDDGHVKVSDFGIAKTADDADQTQTVDLVATLGYVAPERLVGEPASARSDLYSLGVLLYEALSGQRPFSESTPLLEMRAIETGTPVALASLRPELPPTLVATVERAMARDPDNRFPSAAAMAAALDADPQPEPAPAPELEPTVRIAPTVPIEPTRQPSTSQLPTRKVEPDQPARPPSPRTRVVVSTVVLVALCVAVLALVFRNDGPSSSPTSTTGPRGGAPTTTVPPALADALARLEQELAR